MDGVRDGTNNEPSLVHAQSSLCGSGSEIPQLDTVPEKYPG